VANSDFSGGSAESLGVVHRNVYVLSEYRFPGRQIGVIHEAAVSTASPRR
jgi:hypothetical protein